MSQPDHSPAAVKGERAATFTPREIVHELDRFIVGQQAAKRAVAIALRNRWRRRQVSPPLREEILPKNILMVGPTGVGKTEISRRLAKLAGAPFIKVEATSFTEVGYVGRDVEQILRDLVEVGRQMLRERRRREVRARAEDAASRRLVEALVGRSASDETKAAFAARLARGELDDKEVEIELHENPAANLPLFDIPGMPGAQVGMINISDIMGRIMGGGRTHRRRMTVKAAREALIAEESDRLIDEEALNREALKLVEEEGIVFIDEIDKVCAREGVRGADVSREGVQRDLLPLIEGTTVATRYGMLRTDHILFIASGAFHLAKPSDLLPELQGRLPIRVELEPLSEEDFRRILTEPETSLLRQYEALLAAEDVRLVFREDGIAEIARIATELNQSVENIGARRLHTVLEKLLEDVSFEAPDMPAGSLVTVNAAYVRERLSALLTPGDVARYIL
ncbi:MAG: ATP-dependent protease ATPase subunit HslU [Alphaproteobacteria bacterium]|nr:MAG: ATP-dependent protease ATPase subunit HslU [Alphaproteobacteria bacterium]